jgi:hypothetical protein
MGREKDVEKKFTAYLDHILAGEEIQPDPAMDAELRDALDFARKIARAGEEPSAQFKARLKASLLQKLEQREARKKQTRGFRGMFRQPAWQAAVAVILIIIVVSIIWRAGYFPLPKPGQPAAPATTTAAPATTAPAQKLLVSIDAKTDKAVYQPGETVKIELTMKNTSQNTLTVTDFPPILSLMRADTKQPVYTFAAGKGTRTLATNDVATYTYAWNETDFNGQPVTGSYYVELEDLEYNGQPFRLNLNQPAQFEIAPAGLK